MSEIFLEQKLLSVKCHRKRCGECKNQNNTYGHSCHRIKELHKELDQASERSIKSHMEFFTQ